MMLTKHADYSIRVLMYLGARPGRKIPITAVAEAYGISRNHLMKVSQNLARHRFIVGYRGKGGGIALARPAGAIRLDEVLELVEPTFRRHVGTRGPQVQPGDKRFHAALEVARTAFIAALSQYSLADLIDGDAHGGGSRSGRRHDS
jgi:Rrf2 family nitric oxide-sensitive transcriptional repressor